MVTDATARTTTWTAPNGRGRVGRREDDRRVDIRAGRGDGGRALFGDAARPLLTRQGWPELAANGAAFLLAAQINFALSVTFTWRDRLAGQGLWRRWLAFHGAIAGMAVVNMLVFAAARAALPALAASALGIGVAAVGNFVVGDRLVFRGHAPAPTLAPTRRVARGCCSSSPDAAAEEAVA